MEYMLVSTEKYIFFNPEIPGFGLCQSRDSGLRKTSGIPDYNPYSLGLYSKDSRSLYSVSIRS